MDHRRLSPRVQALMPSSVTGGQDSLSLSPSELQPNSKSKPDGLTVRRQLAGVCVTFRARFFLGSLPRHNLEDDEDNESGLRAWDYRAMRHVPWEPLGR